MADWIDHRDRARSMLSLIALGAIGCGLHSWSPPDAPLVRPGSPIFFAVSRAETTGSEHSWKTGGSMPTSNTVDTRFRAIDIRSCRVVRSATVDGDVQVLAWDGVDDDLWFVKPGDLLRDGAVAHDLAGGSIALPPGTYKSDGGLARAPLPTFDDTARGGISVWDVHQRTIGWIPRRPGPFSLFGGDDRMVAVLPSGPDDATLMVVPRGPALDLPHASRISVTTAGLHPESAWLVGGAVALRSETEIATFDLLTGQRLFGMAVPKNMPWRSPWRQSSTVTVLRPGVTADHPSPCFARLEVTDLASGAQWQRPLPSCVTEFGPIEEVDTPVVFLTDTVSAGAHNWATLLAPGAPFIPLGPSVSAHVVRSGDLLFYAPAGSGPRPLMVANLATGERRQATGPFQWLGDFQADPSSETIIIQAAGRLFAYRPSAARLDVCDGD